MEDRWAAASDFLMVPLLSCTAAVKLDYGVPAQARGARALRVLHSDWSIILVAIIFGGNFKIQLMDCFGVITFLLLNTLASLSRCPDGFVPGCALSGLGRKGGGTAWRIHLARRVSVTSS